MADIPSFLVLRSCAENNPKIIVNINEIQSISEIELNGNNCTKIRFIHKNENHYVKETVEEITNLLDKVTSLPF
jgi:hypothetical protein